ncbi:Gfo/Idh/MocA family oxidoreductase [Dehalococcoidia bacterium]|nr:Gfo/Idh/MocA family oxidoreductase [Dehalococcoidia bacterium]
MSKNIAVIGCGYWGKNLVRNFAELGALHTICDADQDRLEQFVSRCPDINAETDYERVVQNREIKGVVVATPAALHYSMAKEALLAGKDVFVEKPLSLRVEEGRELVRLAQEKGKILMVGHLLEYHPAVVKLKELVDRGELGKINYISSNRLNLGKFRTEENILWSFAPHDIAVILLLLAGEMPQEISAHGGCYLHQDIADVTLTTLSFKDGVRAHIFVSWLHPCKEQKLVVVGDKKMALFDDTSREDKLLVYEHQIEWIERRPVPYAKEAKVVKISSEEPLKLECQDFLRCIETRQKPKADGHKGLQVLEILSCCQRSLEENGKVILTGKQQKGIFIHETSIVEEPCEIGEQTKIWHFSHIMPHVTIGKNCVMGQNVFIGKGVKIGNNVKIENNVSVFEGVILEDDVFCGPSCVFTNVINPRSHISRKHELKPTVVKKGATIGANATIICGNTIGRYAFIGAGAVVTRDVPDHALVYGNPGRIEGWVCECGVKLQEEGNNAQCPECGKIHQKQTGRIESKGGS